MYIAIFDSQPQGEAHGLQSNRFLKLPSCPLANKYRAAALEAVERSGERSAAMLSS
jgi:hypothetical protein